MIPEPPGASSGRFYVRGFPRRRPSGYPPSMLRGLLLFLFLGASSRPSAAGVPARMPKDTVKGRTLYEDHCWQCHGPEGRGDGPLSSFFADRPLDLRGRPEELWPSLVAVVQEGRGDMPAFAEVMDRRDSRRILEWLAALDGDALGRDERPTRGQEPAAGEADGEPGAPPDAAVPGKDEPDIPPDGSAPRPPRRDTRSTPDVSTKPAG
ncbi:MAG: hypothetical protein D6798_07785 [Deltaproteobacteria bacterium]|nr:MAG: hypothetical protein D6798_07785 [Deltaproteobacteria bacterium]